MLRLLEAGLAAWRLARMLVKEDGPGDVLANFRKSTGIEYTEHGEILSFSIWNPLYCVHCTSVYTAVLVWFLPRSVRRLLAASGVASLLEEAVGCGKGS